MRRRRCPRERERGVALVLVLWSFMVLGVLAFDFGRWMREDAMAGANFAEETQGYYAAWAGMQTALWKTRQRLAGIDIADPTADESEGDDEEGEEDLVQSESGTFHGVGYEVEVRPECGRIPINRVALDAAAGEADDLEFLKRLVTNLLRGGNATQGIDTRGAAQIEEIVDSIIDWIDPDSSQRLNGAETKWYQDNREYPAENGFILSVEDLLKIRGVTPELFYGVDGRPGLRDVVSVFCGRNDLLGGEEGRIQAEAVDGKVLQALLPDMTPDELAELMDLRESGDRIGFATMLESRLSADPVLASRFEFEADSRPTLVAVTAHNDTPTGRNRSFIAGVFTVEAADVPEPVIWYDRAPFTGALPSGSIPEGAS